MLYSARRSVVAAADRATTDANATLKKRRHVPARRVLMRIFESLYLAPPADSGSRGRRKDYCIHGRNGTKTSLEIADFSIAMQFEKNRIFVQSSTRCC